MEWHSLLTAGSSGYCTPSQWARSPATKVELCRLLMLTQAMTGGVSCLEERNERDK